MEEITRLVGDRIRFFRHLRSLTLQQLADAIGKSKATVSKYEKSEITLDVEVLYEISRALNISMGQLLDFPLPASQGPHSRTHRSEFARADMLYLYSFDGRMMRVTESVIRIEEYEEGTKASMYFDVSPDSADSQECRSYYRGKVDYHTRLICFLLNNQSNEAEKVLLYLYNPIDREPETVGMLSGLSRLNMEPVALRVLVCLHRRKVDDALRQRLLLPRQTAQTVKKLNLFTVSNEWHRDT